MTSEPRQQIAWWSRAVPTIQYPSEPPPGTTTPLKAAILLYRGEIFWRWCGYMWATGFAHGSELVEALGTGGLLSRYPSGMTDNCAAGDTLLVAAERAGWIVRVSSEGIGEKAIATPTPEQRFFGADGAFGNATAKKRSPRLFGWQPVRESALKTWLGF